MISDIKYSGLKSILKKSLRYPKLLYFFSLFIVQIYNILLLPIITGGLSEIDYGNYITIFQFIGFAQAVLSPFYSGGLMKFWNELNLKNRIEYLNSIMLFLIIGFITLISALLPFILSTNYKLVYFDNIDDKLLFLMTIILFIRIINSFLLSFYRINIKPLKHLYYSVIFFLSISIQISLLYFNDQISLENIIYVFLFSELISSIYLLNNYTDYFKFQFRYKYLIKHYSFSFTLILSTICFIIFQNLDRFFLRINSDNLLFAQYSTALSISLISSLFVTAISSSDFPYLKKVSVSLKESNEIIVLKKNQSMYMMYLISIILISSNDLFFKIFAEKYHTVQTTLCLNLLVISNFYRLKYLYNENNLFILDKNKQILITKAFILILGIIFLNFFINKNPLLSFPVAFIMTFILADLISNFMIYSKIVNFSYKDLKVHFNGITLILISFALYLLEVNNVSLGIILFIKIIFILSTLFLLIRKILEKINVSKLW